jgi:hypothetical protein
MGMISAKRVPAVRLVSGLCIVLVCLTGLVTAVHVHPMRGNTPERSCSTCAITHAGAVTVEIRSAVPVLAAFEILKETATSSPSFSRHFSLYIRPPPLA